MTFVVQCLLIGCLEDDKPLSLLDTLWSLADATKISRCLSNFFGATVQALITDLVLHDDVLIEAVRLRFLSHPTMEALNRSWCVIHNQCTGIVSLHHIQVA